jgi:hypothetical protein
MPNFAPHEIPSTSYATCSYLLRCFQDPVRIQFRDVVGEEYLHAAQHEAACLKRAEALRLGDVMGEFESRNIVIIWKYLE